MREKPKEKVKEKENSEFEFYYLNNDKRIEEKYEILFKIDNKIANFYTDIKQLFTNGSDLARIVNKSAKESDVIYIPTDNLLASNPSTIKNAVDNYSWLCVIGPIFIPIYTFKIILLPNFFSFII